MKKNNKKLFAFTLAEAVMSMMIIALVGMASTKILTSANPHIKTNTVRGSYYCVNDNGTIEQAYFNERTKVSSSTNEECIFKTDKRVAKYYIVAYNENDGNYDTISDINPMLEDNTQIIINNNETKIISSDGAQTIINTNSPAAFNASTLDKTAFNKHPSFSGSDYTNIDKLITNKFEDIMQRLTYKRKSNEMVDAFFGSSNLLKSSIQGAVVIIW